MTMKEQQSISVARAMTWLKHFDQNFSGTIERLGVGDVFKDGKSIRTGKTIEDVKGMIDSNLKTVDDLIECASNRRLAVATSNLNTIVKVGVVEMSIAEALLFKAHILPKLDEWAKHVTSQNRSLKNNYATEMAKWENQISSLQAAEIDLLRPTLQPTLIDSSEYVANLIEKINVFKSEIDAALNESNALTMLLL